MIASRQRPEKVAGRGESREELGKRDIEEKKRKVKSGQKSVRFQLGNSRVKSGG